MVSIFTRLAAGTVLALGMMTTPAFAKSSDGHLVFNTIALHFENFDDRNALTPGIGWEYSPSSEVGWHAGTLSDSFGFQATYAGLNYATKPMFKSRLRFIIGGTVLRKQYKKNSGPETKIVPLPAMEFKMSKRAVLNLSGSPQVDFGNHRNNAVLFFQFKLRMK